MRKFISWWWNDKTAREQHNISGFIITSFFIVAAIGALAVFLINWRVLCWGTMVWYFLGFVFGAGVLSGKYAGDQFAKYKQDNEEK
jgi:hypothetical protein